MAMTKRSYEQALHAMQSGVRMMQELGLSDETSGKHLRVGVNSALSDIGAIATLLINAGIFTKEKYVEQITEFMNREADSYEAKLSKHFGREIRLG